MVKKEFQRKQGKSNHFGNPANHSSSVVVGHFFDEELVSQKEEFFKLETGNNKDFSQQFRHKKPGKKTKPKVLTFEQKLELTDQWLEETYPHLFAADDYVLLDNFILRDLKIDYKNNALKKMYPKDLVIKAALSRYKESLGYLEFIREGAVRYNLKGEACGIITKEEEVAARKILATL